MPGDGPLVARLVLSPVLTASVALPIAPTHDATQPPEMLQNLQQVYRNKPVRFLLFPCNQVRAAHARP